MSQLRRELLTAGVPALATGKGRTALGPPYKTATGQWVVLPGGKTEWAGTGEPTGAPAQGVLDTIAAVRQAHVPVQAPEPIDTRVLNRALAKAVRGKPLTAAEAAEIDKAEQS